MKKALSLILAALMLAASFAGCTTLEGEDRGAIIDMYLTTEVVDFDPQLSITDDAQLKLLRLCYEGLTTIGENGKWQKALMKNYTVDVDDGTNFAILITLNDTRWSDGRTVQADDVVYSWKRLMDPDSPNEAASLLYDVKNAYEIKTGDATIDDLGVAAVDTYTVEVQFEQKVDLDQFFENCSSIALVPLREDVITRYGETWASKSTSIVTNGPFCPKEIIPGKSLRLERSSYYYLNPEKEEALDKYVIPYRLLVNYSTGDAAAQFDAFTNGSIFYDGELPRTSKNEDATVTDMMTTHTYVFNNTNPLFEKAEVRRALSMALDRTAIAQLAVYAEPATGYIPNKVYDTTSGTSFRETGGALLSTTGDVAGAKSLLSSAGVTSGSFTISVRGNEVDLAIADYVKGVWEQLGFTVTVEAVANDNMTEDTTVSIDNFQKRYDSGEFDVIAIDMNMLSPDAFSALSQFAVPYSGNGVNMYSETYDLYGHISGYVSEEYTALIDSAFAEKDRTARASLLHQAEQMLLDDMPVCPLLFLQDAYVSSGELSGISSDYYGARNFNKTKLNDYMTYKAATAEESEAEAEAKAEAEAEAEETVH